MREIKFRGFIKNSNEKYKELNWFYGDLVRELKTGKTFIIDLNHFDDNTKLSEVMMEVESESVGQYTGLKDKNKNEIYEGDVVKSNGDFSGVKYVRFIDGFFVATSDSNYSLNQFSDLEIIGNIYENKELAKKWLNG